MHHRSGRNGFFGSIEQMHIFRSERQPDHVADRCVGMTDDAHGEKSDIGDIDIGKAVRAEMFHHINLTDKDAVLFRAE